MVRAWGDAEAAELLETLPQLTGLKTLRIDNDEGGCTEKIAKEMRERLKAALEERGGWLGLAQ